MSLLFNKSTPESYAVSLGFPVLLNLWLDYLEDCESKFQKIETLLKEEDWNNLRILFHSLKSSSLIFGLDKFSELCTKIERNILQNDISDNFISEINSVKNLWLESIHEAMSYFQPK